MRQLNLASLRRLSPVKSSAQEGYASCRRQPAAEYQVSRRRFLQLAGAAGVIHASRSINSYTLDGELTLARDYGRVVLSVNGQERFVIDPLRFAGRPHTWIDSSNRSFQFGLSGARFPGTDLSADVEGELWRATMGWRIRLAFQGISSVFDTYLQPWLTGEPAQCRVTNQFAVCQEGATSIVLTPRRVEFSPAWTLGFQGAPAGVLTVAGYDLPCRTIEASLPDPGTCWLTPKLQRVANWRGARGDAIWGIEPPHGDSGWDYSRDANFFDTATVQTGESAKKERVSAALLERDAQRPKPAAFTKPPFIGTDGEELSLPLTNFRYALQNSDAGVSSALMADVARETSLQLGSLSLFFSNPRSGPALELLSGENGQDSMLAPACSTQPVLGGRVVISEKVPSFASLPLNWHPSTWPKLLCEAKHFLQLSSEERRACLAGNIALSIFRPVDFLNIRIALRNIKFHCHGGDSWFEPDGSGKQAVMVVTFPPQAILEEAIFSSSDPSLTCTGVSRPVKVRSGENTRLVFKLFEKDARMSLDFESLLSWAKLSLVVSPAAQCQVENGVCKHDKYIGVDWINGEPSLPANSADSIETSIEMPARMIVSPTQLEHFETRVEPFGCRNGDSVRYELWTAALNNGGEPQPAQDNGEAGPARPSIRAIAYRKTPNGGDAGTWPLTDLERRAIVTMSSLKGLKRPDDSDYHSAPMFVDHLLLSSGGGFLRGAEAWPPEKNHSLASWKEDLTQAREHLSEVAFRGFLFPTGHPATLIKITRRQWCADNRAPEGLLAYLITRFKVVISKPDLVYADLPGLPNAGRASPFRKITIPIRETPTLYADSVNDVPENAQKYLDDVLRWENSGAAFDATAAPRPTAGPKCPESLRMYWPSIKTGANISHFRFPLVCEDYEGRQTHCDLPLMLVLSSTAFDDDVLNRLFYAYDGTAFASKPGCSANRPQRAVDLDRECSFDGQKVAFAPPSKSGNTSFATHTMRWTAIRPTKTAAEMQKSFFAPWFPGLEFAAIRPEALEHLSEKPPDPVKFEYVGTYIDKGFDGLIDGTQNLANKGEAFLQAVARENAELKMQGRLSGALTSAASKVAGISRHTGVITGDPANLVGGVSAAIQRSTQGVFDPTVTFPKLPNLDSKILGVFSLSDILAPMSDIVREYERVPKLIANEIREVEQQIEKYRTKYEAIRSKIDAIRAAIATEPTQILEQAITIATAQVRTAELAADAIVRGELGALQNIDDWYAALGSVSVAETAIRDQLQNSCRELRTRVENARAAAAESTARALSAPDCANATSLMQVRDCLIAAAVKHGVDSAAYQSLVDLATPALTQLRTYRQQYDALVEKIANHPLNRLLRAIQGLQGTNVSNIDVKLETLVEALGAVASPPDFAVDVGHFVTDEKAQLKAAHDAAVLEFSQAQSQVLNAVSAVVQGQIAAEFTQAQSQATALIAEAKTYFDAVDTLLSDARVNIDNAWNVLNTVATQIRGVVAQINSVLDEVKALLALVRLPRDVTVSYKARPRLQDFPSGDPILRASLDGEAGEASIKTVVTAHLDGSSPNFSIDAELSSFTVRLFPGAEFLEVPFKSFSFRLSDGSSPKIDANIGKVRFLGPLNFVQKLEEKLAFPGNGNGPYVTIDGLAVTAGLRLTIPPIQAGAFTLKNISFSAGVTLSLIGRPATVTFGFAEENHRFLMAYGIFGGGGFFVLQSTLQQVVHMRGALEFGAVAELNLGVAHGSVHFFGGFFFDSQPQSCILKGYLRAGGELDILGLISMSLEFMLGLAYENRGGEAWLVGECSLTVEIDILFFSVTVDLRMRREFSGHQPGERTAQLQPLTLQAPETIVASLVPKPAFPAFNQWHESELSRYAW